MRKKDIKDTSINTRYPQDVLNAIRELATRHQRSFNGEVIWALREYMAKQRDKTNRERE